MCSILHGTAQPTVPVLKKSAPWCLIASACAACCQKRRLGMSVLVARSIFAKVTTRAHTEKLVHFALVSLCKNNDAPQVLQNYQPFECFWQAGAPK